ncbi:hypothetical protein BLA29_006442, partial [Euroglyphus maynei]
MERPFRMVPVCMKQEPTKLRPT